MARAWPCKGLDCGLITKAAPSVSTQGEKCTPEPLAEEDADHLMAVLNDTIRATPGVRSAEAFTYLDLVKQTYSWGTR